MMCYWADRAGRFPALSGSSGNSFQIGGDLRWTAQASILSPRRSGDLSSLDVGAGPGVYSALIALADEQRGFRGRPSVRGNENGV